MNDHDTWRAEVNAMTEVERFSTATECRTTQGLCGGPEDAER